ncbi:MAG: tetratricopeptide repeat protein [Gemmatimonadetes bacterium]|nr:tetratricopeptide repeat protein [Gemmatimonadota bacterium]
MRAKSVLFTLLVLLGGTAIAADVDPRTRPIEPVRDALAKGDVDAAVAAGEQAVAADPKCSVCQQWLGRAYGRAARQASMFTAMSWIEKCRAAFEKAVELDGKNVDARVDLAEFYAEAPGVAGGSLEKARAQAVEIARLDPVVGHVILGRVKMKDKDLPGAEAEYKQAFATDAKSLKALAGLVNFYTEQKRFDDAFAVCAKAQEAAPDSTRAHYQFGKVALLSGREMEKGLARLDLFLAKPPDKDGPTWADAHWRKGNILAALGKKAEAKAEYETALKLNPGHAGAAKDLKSL